MFKDRSSREELMDDLSLEGDALRKNLDELSIINRYLGGDQVVTHALSHLFHQNPSLKQRAITIADWGSGGGDLLRLMARWGRKKQVKMQLTGIDANAFMIEYSKEKSVEYPEISYTQQDIFSSDQQLQGYDIVCLSLFCHHFSNDQLITLFRQVAKQAKVAVIINDLHRHWLAYYSIMFLTWLFRGSYLVRHDAPLSVLRAFRKQELKALLEASGIENYRLRWKWAFRFQVIIQPNPKSM